MPAFLWTCLGEHDFPIPSAIFWFNNCQKCFYPNTWALFNYLVRLISWGSSRADLFFFLNPYMVENSLRWQSLFPGYLWEKCNLLYSFALRCFSSFVFFPAFWFCWLLSLLVISQLPGIWRTSLSSFLLIFKSAHNTSKMPHISWLTPGWQKARYRRWASRKKSFPVDSVTWLSSKPERLAVYTSCWWFQRQASTWTRHDGWGTDALYRVEYWFKDSFQAYSTISFLVLWWELITHTYTHTLVSPS